VAEEQDRIRQLERLAELHSAGALTDEEYSALKRQTIEESASTKRAEDKSARRARSSSVVLITGIAVALLSGLVLYIVLQGGGDQTALEASPSAEASIATSSTVVSVATTVESGATTDQAISTTTTTISARELSERREALVEGSYGGYTAGLAGTLMGIRQREGPLWAPNRRPDDDIMQCAMTEWARMNGVSDLDARIRDVIAKYEQEGGDLYALGYGLIHEEIGLPYIPRMSKAESDLQYYFLLICAGFNETQARQASGL
jgi:hypothetical protein